MVNKVKEKLRIWYWELYRYFFIPKKTSYEIPEGMRMFEYDLMTREVRKAEYKNHKGHRIFVKKPNCIYNYDINMRNSRIQFETLINNALKK